MTSKVYQIITDKIIDLLKKGDVPWSKPWVGGGVPKSLNTGRPYRGLNSLYLNAVALEKGYTSQYWVTYKQAEKMGGQVRKGEKSSVVLFWKWIDKETEDGEIERFAILRYYSVFNTDQVDGLEVPAVELPDNFSPIDAADQIIDNMADAPEITHGGTRAFYNTLKDTITLPDRERFVNPEEYYSTAFHELVHSTGHVSRLGRFDLEVDDHLFGSASYSKEELTAEMGAAMLCGVAGIEMVTIENSAAYIRGWLKALEDDNTFVVRAAAHAQKAADRVLGQNWAE